jgi:hypothetical protein
MDGGALIQKRPGVVFGGDDALGPLGGGVAHGVANDGDGAGDGPQLQQPGAQALTHRAGRGGRCAGAW